MALCRTVDAIQGVTEQLVCRLKALPSKCTQILCAQRVVIARNYIENLREEVRKGMREKAEQGNFRVRRNPFLYRFKLALSSCELVRQPTRYLKMSAPV